MPLGSAEGGVALAEELADRLFLDAELTNRVPQGDAAALDDTELPMTRDPAQALFKKADGGVAQRLVGAPSPADWAAMDGVEVEALIILDRAVLVADLREHAGHSRQPELQLGWQGKHLESQVAHASQGAKVAQDVVERRPGGAPGQTSASAGAVHLLQGAVHRREIGKVQLPAEIVRRIVIDPRLEACQIE